MTSDHVRAMAVSLAALRRRLEALALSDNPPAAEVEDLKRRIAILERIVPPGATTTQQSGPRR